MRKTLMWVLAAGCCVGSYATDARVVSMGRHDAFFMDEVSIFRNPANISIYPNMVYGSIGVYKPNDSLDNVGTGSAIDKYNRDPIDPFWGAIISYSLEHGTDGGNQYPMLSFGAIVNRRDEMLDYISKGTDKFIGTEKDKVVEPVGKVDLLLGYVLKNGGMIGGGVYGALQNDKRNNVLNKSALYKGNLGLNWPIAKTMDLEISVGMGMMTLIADTNGVRPDTLAKNNYFGRVEGRLFSALSSLNGDFVPHVRLDVLELSRFKVTKVDLAAGIGLNLNFDKGFFWSGLEFLYGQKDSANYSAKEYVGGRISFGIERNIWTDWLVIRAGGQKSIVYMKENSNSRYIENASADQSDHDMLGIGFGINIDNRLRIDFVAAEDIAFTFTNLFSAPQHHLFNRVSATYSF
ncbi:MAG: hypothetical protein GX640_14435 [Fibrobacter sp.]|nr:hypothetical protein [Fibrobacter sp.]